MKPEKVNKVIAALELAKNVSYSDANNTKFYEALSIMRGVAAEPEGWKLVPIEPTPEMCQAGGKAMFTASWESEDAEAADIYRAMLAAAPEAP